MIANINSLINSALIQNKSIQFPDDAERGVFLEAKKMMDKIGGTWVSGKTPHFSFEFNPQSIVDQFLTDGSWPKKNKWSFYPTPQSVIDYILEFSEASPEHFSHYDRPVRILEPSAGRGNLAIALRDKYLSLGIDVDITCVELDPVNAVYLREEGFHVIQDDFLTLDKDTLGEFDIVVMNPPFNGSECADHVFHAQSFLPKYRFVVAVLPTTLFSSKYKKVEKLCHDISVLNIGDFDDCVFGSGTFDDTKVETMVINFPSEKINANDLELAYQLFSEHLFVTIKNDPKLNDEARNVSCLDESIKLATRVSKSNREFKFVKFNDAIIADCAKNLFDEKSKDEEIQNKRTMENDACLSFDDLIEGTKKIDQSLSEIAKTQNKIALNLGVVEY